MIQEAETKCGVCTYYLVSVKVCLSIAAAEYSSARFLLPWSFAFNICRFHIAKIVEDVS